MRFPTPPWNSVNSFAHGVIFQRNYLLLRRSLSGKMMCGGGPGLARIQAAPPVSEAPERHAGAAPSAGARSQRSLFKEEKMGAEGGLR